MEASTFQVGEDLRLNVLVQDLRDPAFGVSAAHLDVGFDPALITATSGINHGPDFDTITHGTINAVSGLIDDAGGAGDLTPLPADPQAAKLLFSVDFQADQAGSFSFTATMADPLFEILLHQNGMVDFDTDVMVTGGDSITITETDTVAYTLVVTDLSGTELTRQTPGDPATPYLVNPGQMFQAQVFVDDLRTDVGASGGVSAAFADLVANTVTGSGTLVNWDSASLEIEFPVLTPPLPAVSGATVDEAGGGLNVLTPPGADPKQLLFTINGTVSAAAMDNDRVTLALDAADALPDHETLVRGIANAVSASYESQDLLIVAENTDAIVAYTLVLKDTTGTELPRQTPGDPSTPYVVSAGQRFVAEVYADDLRTDVGANGGVSAAFTDLVSGDTSLVTWDCATPMIQFPVLVAPLPACSTGLFDEAGGGLNSLTPPGADPEQLLFTIEGIVAATATGGDQTTLSLDEAEALPDHATLVRGIPNAVPATYEAEQIVVAADITASLSLDKTFMLTNDVNNNSMVDAGDTITYSYVITNDGGVTISNLTLDDDIEGMLTPSATTLAPTETASATSDHVVTQTEFDSLTLVNVATAAGTDPMDAPVTATDTVTVDNFTAHNPSLTVDKTFILSNDPDNNGTVDAGDTITYSYVIVNDGNVTISNLTLDDDIEGMLTLSATTLAPTETATATSDHVVTQAEFDVLTLINVATAAGTDPMDAPVTATDTATIDNFSEQDPSLTVAKTFILSNDPDNNGTVDAGDTITYSYVIVNDGNVTISDLTLDDNIEGMLTIGATTLAPLETVTATSDHVVTQAEFDALTLINVATATGTDPMDAPVTATDTATIDIFSAQEPSLTVNKTFVLSEDVNNNGTVDAGDTITYNYVITNDGNVTISNLTLDDNIEGPLAISATTLAPLETATATSDHVVTQAEFDALTLINVATAAGTDPMDSPVTATDTVTVDNFTAHDPSLTVVKTFVLSDDMNSIGVVDVGDTITYSYVITNDGNVTISNLTLDDNIEGMLSISATTLAPMETATATSDHVVTQVEFDSGVLTNTATAQGDPPMGDPVEGSDSVTIAFQPLAGTKSFMLTTDNNGNGRPDVGDVITYSYTVTNNGTVTVNGVTAIDDVEGTLTLVDSAGNGAGVLAAGETETATSMHTIMQSEFNAGSLTNMVTITGFLPPPTPADPPVSIPPVDPPPTQTVQFATPSIRVDKSFAVTTDANGNGRADVGDVITYSYTVTNDGTTNNLDQDLLLLEGVTLIDDVEGMLTLSDDAGDGVDVIAAGDMETAMATHIVSQADFDSGALINRATATGTPPTGTPVTNSQTVTVQFDPMNAALSGFVYVDTNNDGNRDVGTELGVPGVMIVLSGTTELGGTVELTAMTGNDGSYAFVDLSAGTYEIQEIQPNGLIDGTDSIGTQGGDVANDRLFNIVLEPSEIGVENNFGEQGLIPQLITKAMFYTNRLERHLMLRELVAVGEELAGDPETATVIRGGDTESNPSVRSAKVLFFDGFDLPQLDTMKFDVPTGAAAIQQRTQFRPIDSPPDVENGVVRLAVDTFNPSSPGGTFLGTEIITKQEFEVGTGLAVEARARIVSPQGNPVSAGLVGGIALTNSNETARDEIDVQLLTTDVVDDSERVFTNVFENADVSAGAAGDSAFAGLVGLDLTQFNTYRIEWLPDQVRWLINGQVVRTENDTVPDSPMHVELNLWAPDSSFAEAFDAALQPADSAADNDEYFFDVDFVRVTRAVDELFASGGP